MFTFPTACWTRAEDLCWNTISVTNKQNFKSYNQSVLIRTLNGYNGEICLQENGCKLTKTCLPDYTVAEDSPRSYNCDWNGIWNDNLFGTKDYCPVCRSGNFVSCVFINTTHVSFFTGDLEILERSPGGAILPSVYWSLQDPKLLPRSY